MTDIIDSPAVGEQEQPSGRADAVPYVAFSRFSSLIERVRREGLPQVFDQSFFGAQSGSLTAQQRGALKFLGLIDDDRRPTDMFRELVKADEASEKDLLKMLAEEKYATQLGLGLDATRGQLAETFRESGLNGETVNKAIAFFVTLADKVELQISPHFKKGASTTGSGNGSSRRAPRRKKAPETPGTSAAVPPTPPPAHSLASPEAQRAAYVSMLMSMAQKSGDDGKLQTDLLDRIEKALGLADQAAATSQEARVGGE